MSFPERDWKILSRLKLLALERLCRRILDGAQAIIATAEEGKSHQTYLALYRYIREQDRVVAACFDDWRRSQAMLRLAFWCRYQLITEEELAEFTPETRKAAKWFSAEILER